MLKKFAVHRGTIPLSSGMLRQEVSNQLWWDHCTLYIQLKDKSCTKTIVLPTPPPLIFFFFFSFDRRETKCLILSPTQHFVDVLHLGALTDILDYGILAAKVKQNNAHSLNLFFFFSKNQNFSLLGDISRSVFCCLCLKQSHLGAFVKYRH